MLPKLHKSKEINEIMEIKHTMYIQMDEDILIEGRPEKLRKNSNNRKK